MRKILLVLSVSLLAISLQGKQYSVSSPSEKIEVIVSVNEKISYSVLLDGKEIISPSTISMMLDDGLVLGENLNVKKVKTVSISEIIKPVVQRKYATIKDEYNLLHIIFKGYSLQFRVYDEGTAYRWLTEKKGVYKVLNEEVAFNFPGNHEIWFPEEKSMMSHQEREYLRLNLSDINEDRFCSTGMLVDCGNHAKVYISESDLTDYPGMFLKGSKVNPNRLVGKFAGVVVETQQSSDRDVFPTKYADYIAECEGSRSFPWRVMLISTNDADLVKSELIYKLAPTQKIENTDWIKPGKVAWDWWNANNIYGVDFESGINNETYKYYVDFASKYHLDYIILDEGWYHLEDIIKVKDEIDVKELVSYGEKRDVGIILWVVWKALDDQLIEALDQFEEWGIKGIKIDFMQRDDQWMVNFYEKIAKECANRKLLVDFHGAYKPSGLNRAYPNVITFEGVKGLENTKWSNQPDPEHNVTLPFTRMVAGPMDFTPGAMLNTTKENFNPVFTEPMSPGTRCHQLGMYVVFESPLQMLADNPSNYYREPVCMEFLEAVPTVWDDTKVLDARVSDYVLIARRSGNTWFIGAMTDWDARELELDLSFLGDGNYSMQIWKDGINADKHAADFTKEEMQVSNSTKTQIRMASGGGWVAIIRNNKYYQWEPSLKEEGPNGSGKQ